MSNYHAYVVFVGTQPGVYRAWKDVVKRCTGISGASFKGYGDWEEAQETFERAYAEGDTRVVHPPPQDSPPPPPQRQRCIPRPTQQTSGATTRSGGTMGRHSERDDQIVPALAEVTREGRRTRVCASTSSPGVIEGRHTSRTDNGGQVITRAATAPPRRAPVVGPAPPIAGVRVECAVPIQAVQHTRSIDKRGGKTKQPLGGPSTSSSPATGITQTKNVFTPSSGSAGRSPRYAQSLSYASSPENSPTGLQSPSLASSDRRTYLSPPSSLGTRYFPEDYLAREAHAKGAKTVGPARAHSPAMAEYATALNTPEVQRADLPDVQRIANITVASLEESPARYALSRLRESLVATSPERLSPKPAATLSLASTSSVNSPPFTPPANVAPREARSKTPVSRSYSEAEVQAELLACGHELPEVAVQIASPPKKRYTNEGAQTSARATPLRATIGVGDVPVHPPADGPTCACEHPELACLHCGLRSRAMQPAANCLVHPASAPVASSAPPATGSPASLATPMSAASASFHPCWPPVQGGCAPHTGPSEIHLAPSPVASLRVQAGLDTLSFAETARGTEAVVHDIHFDPRSPIQRGTSIPAGSSGLAVRSSPVMMALPMNSLLFSP